MPVTPEVCRAFTELWQQHRLDTQRVFLYKDEPIRDLKTAFEKACRREGFPKLCFHYLRDTASTTLRRPGVDAITAMNIVGHEWNGCIGGTIPLSLESFI